MGTDITQLFMLSKFFLQEEKPTRKKSVVKKKRRKMISFQSRALKCADEKQKKPNANTKLYNVDDSSVSYHNNAETFCQIQKLLLDV